MDGKPNSQGNFEGHWKSVGIFRLELNFNLNFINLYHFVPSAMQQTRLLSKLPQFQSHHFDIGCLINAKIKCTLYQI